MGQAQERREPQGPRQQPWHKTASLERLCGPWGASMHGEEAVWESEGALEGATADAE